MLLPGKPVKFPGSLHSAVLLRRYKRFLADIELPDGGQMTLHCPNTGSMKNCQEPGSRVWYTLSDNPKRKYPGTRQLVEVDGRYLVGINTGLANKLVYEAVSTGQVAELLGYSRIRAEVPYGEQRSRIDLLLDSPEDPDTPACYVEVKNVSLGMADKQGLFPDAVTTRGQKHLQELMEMVRQGRRAVLFFCVQHTGIERVSPADDIDPEYGRLLREAVEAGVEVLAMGTGYELDEAELQLTNKVDVVL